MASDSTFLQATAVLPLPTTAAIAGEVYAEVDFPTNAVSVYGVRVQFSATSRWIPLQRIPWAAYHDFQLHGLWNQYAQQNLPCAYVTREMPKGVEAVETAGKVMILPVPKGGNYRLWYMEAWTPQVEEDDIFAGTEDWFEFAIYHTLIKMSGPDADSRKSYAMWAMERAEARALIESRARRLDDGTTLEPRNARGDGYDLDTWGGDL